MVSNSGTTPTGLDGGVCASPGSRMPASFSSSAASSMSLTEVHMLMM